MPQACTRRIALFLLTFLSLAHPGIDALIAVISLSQFIAIALDMIPESEGCPPRRSTDAAVSVPAPRLLGWEHQYQHQQQQQTDKQLSSSSAWTRYRYFVEAMHSQGRAFNRKLVLEAMFRGSNLVYSRRPSSPCPS